MKKIPLVGVVLLFTLSSFTLQSGIESVIGALKSGNSSNLARYFDAYVDITMPDKSNSYSKSQAELILKDFFATTGVKTFEVKHKGESDGNNSQYCIGTLQTKSGNYRVNVFMKNKNDKMLIQELRIQQQ
ncbi:MAG: DUF4783 domain-containing protein [Chitinophagaceae bacterium]|nr:DUF4783 domain-containing protein [Chitinophagaceae bacterium]MBN8668968.1 DUF4783 domain-containing protein [Chitinophagales bacterium]